MKKKEIEAVIEGVLNEKLQWLLGRIDFFQNTMLDQIDALKNPEEFVRFEMPGGFSESGDGSASIDHLNHYVRGIADAANQLNLITSLLEGINKFCGRAALFLLRDDKLVGWKGQGFSGNNGEVSDEEIKKIFFSITAQTIFKKVLETHTPYLGAPNTEADDFLIYNRFGGAKPEQILVMPFFVKGKPQAVIYADSLHGRPVQRKEIEIIATVGELSLDLLPFKQKFLARVKTQEFIDAPEPPVSPARTVTPPTPPSVPPQAAQYTPVRIEEMEKTAAPIRESDPQRFARVIIYDIILYNQKVVDEGLKNRNLYDMLKETLIQAREEYLRKYNDLSYFEDQLIKILARGDREALKGYEFEALK